MIGTLSDSAPPKKKTVSFPSSRSYRLRHVFAYVLVFATSCLIIVRRISGIRKMNPAV